jgi:type IV pilus assembly protein PilZ
MDTPSEAAPERTSERFAVDIQVDCATRDMFVSNRVMNISRGGLFIASEQPLPISTQVRLKLSLGDSVTIEAQGRVIWNYDIRKGSSKVIPGTGIKFLDLSPEHAAHLESYLSGLTSPLPKGN